MHDAILHDFPARDQTGACRRQRRLGPVTARSLGGAARSSIGARCWSRRTSIRVIRASPDI